MLKEASMINSSFSCNISSEKSIFPLVEKKYAMVEKSMNEVSTKLSELESQLFRSLTYCKQHSYDEDECKRWLTKTEKDLMEQKPVSAKKTVNSQQLIDQKNIVEDVRIQSSKFDIFFESEKCMLDKNDIQNLEVLNGHKTAILKRWVEINHNVKSRENCLKEVVQLSVKVDDCFSAVIPWLSNAEKSFKELSSISVKSNMLLKQIFNIDEMMTQLAEKKPIIIELHECCCELEKKAECDCEDILDVSNLTYKQFMELEKNLISVKDKAIRMKEKVEHFSKMQNIIEELCTKVHSTCDEISLCGDDVKKADYDKEILQILLHEINEKNLEIDILRQAGNELILIDGQLDNVLTINETVTSLEEKVCDALVKTGNLLKNVEKTRDAAVKLQNILSSVKMESVKLVNKSKSLDSIGSTIEKVKVQLSEVNELQNELQNIYNDYKLAEVLADEITSISNKEPAIQERLQYLLQNTKSILKDNEILFTTREQQLKDKLKSSGDLKDQVENALRKLKLIYKRLDQQNSKPLSVNPAQIAINISELQVLNCFFVILFKMFFCFFC